MPGGIAPYGWCPLKTPAILPLTLPALRVDCGSCRLESPHPSHRFAAGPFPLPQAGEGVLAAVKMQIVLRSAFCSPTGEKTEQEAEGEGGGEGGGGGLADRDGNVFELCFEGT